MENSSDTIIVRVLPYNKEYDNTKDLKKFKKYIANDIKKNELDTRTDFIWDKEGKALPTGTLILFLYEKKFYGYASLDSVKKNPKIKSPDNVVIKFLPNTVNVLETGIPLSVLNIFGYKHSNQSGSSIECEKKEIYEILNGDYSKNIDDTLDKNYIIENYSEWNINSLFPTGEYSKKPMIGKKTSKSGTEKTGIDKAKKGRIGERKVINFLVYNGFKLKKNIFDVANNSKIFWDITVKLSNLEKGLEVKNLTNSNYFYLSQNQIECLKMQETKLCLIDTIGKCLWISKNFNQLKCLPKIINNIETIKNNVYDGYNGLFQVDDVRINLDTKIDCWYNDFVRIDSSNSKEEIFNAIFK